MPIPITMPPWIWLVAVFGFAGAFYPSANPPPALAEVYESNPELTALRVSFPHAMRRVLTVLVAGFPAARG